jgi:hypothetical protein
VTASRCVTQLCFDVTRSAGSFSALSGVLAGFAFLAIVLLLQGRPAEQPTARDRPGGTHGLQNVLISFTTGFVTAVIAAFLFAQVSREEVVSSRAMAQAFLSSLALSMAVLVLFHGIVWMFRTWDLERAAGVTARIAAMVLPALIFLYMAALGLDALALQEGYRPTGTWLGILMLALLVALAALSVAAAKSPALRARAKPLASDRAVRRGADVALGIAAASAVANGVVGRLGLGASLHREGTALVMVVLFIVLALYALLIQAVEHVAIPGSD